MKTSRDSSVGRKSITRRLTSAVLIPSVALLVMWTVVSSYLLFDGFYVREVAAGVRQVSIPAVAALASAQKERQLSLAYLWRPATGMSELHLQQRQTDQALEVMRKAVGPVLEHAPDSVVERVVKLNQSLDQLPRIRTDIDAGTADKNQVNTAYNVLLDAATSLFDTQARIVPDVTATQGAIAATSVFRSADLMSRATSVIASAYAAGDLSSPDHLLFTSLVGSYHAELTKTSPFLRPGVQERYQRLVASDAWKALVDAENGVIERSVPGGRGPVTFPVSEGEWRRLTNEVAKELTELTVRQADEVSAQALDDGTRKFTSVAIGSAIALLAAIAAILVAVKVSRTLVDRALVTRLRRLTDDARRLGTRLPEIVERLKAGQSLDVTVELPVLEQGGDEIGQMARAFSETQHTAVVAAVDEARARDGVRNVFLAIAHRNQGLVHRQLKILDEMERREESPEQLARLFRIDHLATQARRNAENLMILGGEQPGRQWRKPARLVDVLRAAVGETEQYLRVEVGHVPGAAIVGSAVADAIHLLAELVDNATAFSPPPAPVRVSSILVARGVVIEVEDEGLGMSEQDRQRANAMIADPPEFDAMALKTDPRLGLFVVARLAARLGATVEFRPSPYGGTRVIVLIPAQVLAQGGQESGEIEPGPALSRRTARMQGSPSPEGDFARRLTSGRQWLARREAAGTPSGGGVVSVAIGRPAKVIAQAQLPVAKQEPVAAQEGSPPARPRLPRRNPQTNLAPQLRRDAVEESAESGESRSAEEIRRTMSAFQKGTREGRQTGEPS